MATAKATTKAGAAGLALLGGGVMGSAVLESVLREGLYDADDVRVTTLDPAARKRWEDAGVQVVDNAEAVREARLVVVAVKPADVGPLLDEVSSALPDGVLVACLAAGVSTATLEEHLPERTPVVRIMPNTPALLGEGMSALSGGTHCTPEQLEEVRRLMEACGRVVVVPEKQQDAVTAVSGSGPAYVFAVAEAMIEGGVLLGLPRPVAAELAVQTIYGAATMMRESDDSPSILRERVTSPGGTTAVGLRELARGGLAATFLSAVEGAAARSAELGG